MKIPEPQGVSELTAAISRWQMKNDVTDYALAKQLGCSPNTPLGWRAGRAIDLTPERAEAIASLLNVTVEDVLVMRGFRLGGGGDTGTVGASPRSARSRKQTAVVDIATARNWTAPVLPIAGQGAA